MNQSVLGGSSPAIKWIISMVIGFVSFQDRVVGPLPNGRSPLMNGGDPNHLQVLG